MNIAKARHALVDLYKKEIVKADTAGELPT